MKVSQHFLCNSTNIGLTENIPSTAFACCKGSAGDIFGQTNIGTNIGLTENIPSTAFATVAILVWPKISPALLLQWF